MIFIFINYSFLVIELINKSKPTQEMIALRSLEALEKVGNGNATKIIIPSEIQRLAGLAASAKEIMR